MGYFDMYVLVVLPVPTFHSESHSKGGRTPTASRQASGHETKETKADVSIMTQTGVRRFL
jgi:hypothetical protein